MKRNIKNPAGKSRKPVTMADVGEEAGVSFSIVSRVLSNHEDRIPEKTRERVKNAAERLGYRRNLLIRGVQTGRSMNVGVVVPPTGDFYSLIVQGVHDELRKNGYCVLLAWNPIEEADSENRTERELIHSLVDRRVDGVILRPTNADVSDLYYSEVQERHIPMVTVDRPLPGVHCDFAGTDDEQGARLATRYLIEKGHRRLAHLHIHSPFQNAALRRKGFEAECAACPHVEAVIPEFPFPHQAGDVETAIRNLLDSDARPTALFLNSDNLAPMVYRVAAELGLRLPEDLSLIGFGNADEGHVINPFLASIDQDPYRIGVHAVQLFLQRIAADGSAPKQLLTEPKLICRDSVAAAGPTDK